MAVGVVGLEYKMSFRGKSALPKSLTEKCKAALSLFEVSEALSAFGVQPHMQAQPFKVKHLSWGVYW